MLDNMTRSFFIFCLVVTSVTYLLSDELQRSIPDSETALVTQSKELRLREHDLATAESVLKDVLKRYPTYYKAHYNLGLVYQDKGDYDSAISELETARSIRESENLQDYSIYNTLGWVYMQKGETKTAEKYYLEALNYESKNTPDSNTRLYNNLGWFYYTLGKPDEAEKYVDVAADKYHSTSATELKGLIEQLKVDKQAIKAKTLQIERKPAQIERKPLVIRSPKATTPTERPLPQ